MKGICHISSEPPAWPYSSRIKEQLLKQLNDISQLNTIFKSRITREINDLQIQGKNLFDFCLKGNFPYSFYESKKAEIDNQIKELEKSLEKYKTIDNDMKQNVVNVISMAANISDIFDKATPDKKNQLLRLLITDCKLNGKRLEYRLKAPFDKLITCTDLGIIGYILLCLICLRSVSF